MSAIDFTEKASCRFSDWIDKITQVCSSRYQKLFVSCESAVYAQKKLIFVEEEKHTKHIITLCIIECD